MANQMLWNVPRALWEASPDLRSEKVSGRSHKQLRAASCPVAAAKPLPLPGPQFPHLYRDRLAFKLLKTSGLTFQCNGQDLLQKGSKETPEVSDNTQEPPARPSGTG